MEVLLSEPAPSDAAEFIDAVRASRALHVPWLEMPGTPELFAAYLERAARDDQASYLIRHRACGSLVGVVNVNNIVRGALQSGRPGFLQEGFSRRYLRVGGEWRDHERWALLADDFPATSAPAEETARPRSARCGQAGAV